MKKFTVVIAIALIILSPVVFAVVDVSESHPPGCTKGGCHVSLLQVIGNPSFYNKKKISMVGYLTVDNHILVLYPTEEHYRIFDVASSIGFRVPASKQLEFSRSSL